MKKTLLLILGLLSTFLLSGAERKLVIVQTTDIHGSIGVVDKNPGIARLASLANQFRRDAEKNSAGFLLIDCGDLMQGSFPVSFDKGKVMIDALNAMKYDIFVPGNHDFDYGPKVLVERMKLFQGERLAANISVEGEKSLFKPWVLLERGGIRIAVIGLTADYLRQWIGKAQLEGIIQTGIEDALEKIMPDIMEKNPDIIILATHAGEFSSARLHADGKRHGISELTARFPQIVLVLGGHSHQTVPGKKLYPESWFAQAGALSESVIRADLVYDDVRRKVVSIQSRAISATDIPEDADVLKVLEPVRKQAEELAVRPVAEIPFELEPMKKVNPDNALAKLFGKALLHLFHKGDTLVMHGTLSNYRKKAGVLTELDIFLLAPYENYLVLLNKLSADQLKILLKEQYTLKEPKNFMLLESGIPSQIHYKQIEGTLFDQNGPVEKDRMFSCIFGSYAVSGAGGRYPKLREIAETAERTDLEITVRDALRKYLLQNFPPVTPFEK